MTLHTIDFKKIKINKNDRILDLGCGIGRHLYTAYQNDNLEIIGLDRGFTDLKTAKDRKKDFDHLDNSNRHLHFVHGDGLKLPFQDNTFDIVICSEVLEHILDFRSVIKEIKRVLRPQGTFAVSVPNFLPEAICWQLSTDYIDDTGHLRIFRGEELPSAIKATGMKLYHKHYEHGYHSAYWWLKCILWDQPDDHFALKKYEDFLNWELFKAPKASRLVEKMINPVLGKSVVYYFINH